MRKLLSTLLILAVLALTAWWVYARPPGTTFIGAPYTSNQNINDALKMIDDVMCGGLAPVAPCQLPPTKSLTVSGLLTAGQLSVGSFSLSGPLTVNGLVSTSYVHAAADITGASVAATGNVSSNASLIGTTLAVTGATPGQVDATVMGVAAQSANLQEWRLQFSDPGPTTYIDKNGVLNLSAAGSVAGSGQLSYDAASGVGAVSINYLEINRKLLNNAGAAVATRNGCTTAATLNAQCTDTLSWGVTLNSTQYHPVCTCEFGAGLPVIMATNLTTTSVQIITTTMNSAAANCAKINCHAFVQ